MEKENKLDSFVHEFAKSDGTIENLITSIENNYLYDELNITIQQALSKAKLITIGIGMDELANKSIKQTLSTKEKEEKGRWYLGTTKTLGSQREVYICDSLYSILSDYKKLQNKNKKEYGKKYKQYILEEVKNKYGKLVEYKVKESNSSHCRVQMLFTRKDGTYSGTDIIKYPFKIIHHELGINCRFYDLRGSFATISLRNGCETKDIAEVLGHKRIETTEKYYIKCTKEDIIMVYETYESKRKL